MVRGSPNFHDESRESGIVTSAGGGGGLASRPGPCAQLCRRRESELTKLLLGPAGAEGSRPGGVEFASCGDGLLFGVLCCDGSFDEVADRVDLRVDGPFEGCACFRGELFGV